jgi:hypothetical protein
MAVAFVMRFPGATLEQYDEVIELMGFSHNGTVTMEGAVFHWVAATDDGIVVTDVWESDETFQRFADEQIGPFTKQVGIAEPEVTRHEVYNTLVSERIGARVSA